jgi:hypothetical protein
MNFSHDVHEEMPFAAGAVPLQSCRQRCPAQRNAGVDGNCRRPSLSRQTKSTCWLVRPYLLKEITLPMHFQALHRLVTPPPYRVVTTRALTTR